MSKEQTWQFSRTSILMFPPPSIEAMSILYQFIFIFASISVWKLGTSRSSLPVTWVSGLFIKNTLRPLIFLSGPFSHLSFLSSLRLTWTYQ